MAHDVASLNGQERLDLPLVGRRDEHLGHFARRVGLLVGDQLDAVVALLPPAYELAAADPEVGGAADLVLQLVTAHGHHLVASALLRDEGSRRLPVGIGGHLGCQHGRVLDLARPVEAPVVGLLLDAVPFMLEECYRQGHIGHRLALPVHGDDVYLLLFAYRAHPGPGAQADVVEALVDDGLCAGADLLVVDVGNRGLDGEDLAQLLQRDVGWHAESKAALRVGLPRALGDQLAEGAVVVTPFLPFVINEVVTALASPGEEVVLAEDAPVHLGIGHRPAEVVAGGRAHGDLVPLHVGVSVGDDGHLVLRPAVLSHLEADSKALISQLSIDPVVAQDGFLIQGELAVEGAHIAEGQILSINLLALVVADGHSQAPYAFGQAVAGVVVGAQNALEADRLARSVDGPVGVEVARVGLTVELGGDVELPGTDALTPAVEGYGEVIALASEDEEGIPHILGWELGPEDAVLACMPFSEDGEFALQAHRKARDDLPTGQVRSPDQGFRLALFEGQVEAGDDHDLARGAPVRQLQHFGGSDLKIVDAWSQRPPLLAGYIGAQHANLVEGGVSVLGPMAHQGLRVGAEVVPIAPGLAAVEVNEVLPIQTVEAEVQAGDVEITGVDDGLGVGVIGAHVAGASKVGPGIQAAGGEAHQLVFAQGIPAGVGYLRPEGEDVAGGGLDIEGYEEAVVVVIPVGVDLGRFRNDGGVGHDGGHVHGAGEEHLHAAVGIRFQIAVGRIGLNDAGVGDGNEAPGVGSGYASLSSRRLASRLQSGHVAGLQRQRGRRHKSHSLLIPVEIALHSRAGLFY